MNATILTVLISLPSNNMLISSIVLGLLVPVLAFSIASGSGIQALSTISYSAQPFRIVTGITPYCQETVNGGSRGNRGTGGSTNE